MNRFRFATPIVAGSGQACLLFSLSLFGSGMGYLTIFQNTYVPALRAFTRRAVFKEGGYSIRPDEIEDIASFWLPRGLPVDLNPAIPIFVSFASVV